MQHANIISNDSLNVRLAANRDFGAFDFHRWVFENYRFAPGEDVLDVGCGNGVQALEALRAIGPKGSVHGVDISAEAVAQLRKAAGGAANLDVRVGDMRELQGMVDGDFAGKRYDIAHSTYALFYAVDHVRVLEAMRKALKPGGRLAVATPVGPNGLRQIINRLGFPTPELAQIDRFGTDVLEPYFRGFFNKVTILIRRNVLKIPTLDELMKLYRTTAYHRAEAEAGLARLAQAEIEAKGHFAFEKNAYMIIGEDHG